MGYGKAVLPIDRVGIKHELCFYGFCIVEDKHTVAAHNDKFLLFVGVEPAHEDMCADPRGEFQICHRYVGDAGVQEVAAHRIDIARLFTGQAQDDRDVVRGERPQNVFLPADLAQGKAARIDILKAAYGPLVDEFLQADHGGVVLKDVADEEDFLLFLRQTDQGVAFRVGQRQGLFDEDVLARLESLRGQCVVPGGRGGDDDGLDGGIGQYGAGVVSDDGIRVIFGHLLADGDGLVADGFQDAQLMEITDEVLSPVSRADDGNVFFSHEIPFFFWESGLEGQPMGSGL